MLVILTTSRGLPLLLVGRLPPEMRKRTRTFGIASSDVELPTNLRVRIRNTFSILEVQEYNDADAVRIQYYM
jgi:hypothetical protein